MATTQLSDVVIPEVYATYGTENNPERTAFYDSGVVTRNAMLDQKANAGGKTLDVPFWKDLDPDSEPNISTDDPTDVATPEKIAAADQIARVAYLNKGYSAANLTAEIAGSDPMQRIRNRFGTYWTRQWQRRLLASAQGIVADNVANDSGDMVHDISIEDGSNASAANKYSRSAFVTAAFTMGDMYDSVTAIAVHSMIYQTMVDNDDIAFIPDSNGALTIPTYMGRRVIVDDQMPVIAGGTSGFKYHTYLFSNGAFGYGVGSPRKPVALQEEEDQGNGAGVETLWERRTWLLHPFGFQFTSSSVASESATTAELKLAANWDRVFEHRKNIPFAVLISN